MLEKLSSIALGASLAFLFMFLGQKYSKETFSTKPRLFLWIGVGLFLLALILGFNTSDFMRGFQDGYNGATQPK
ncbi:MAG: hypothetical protein MUF71_22040 [Candidatus Kapabacteria bacterium]|nr:hypothetical protein [Candidatus Kapabacteria bacterium]